ncbi:MAG: hypothetical protein PHC60_06100 [Heliobacteriaceae bacterium]|nr:hypothetical protein [Heliobacteriaceae bacterium]MDD4587938.1 hypothetical protein [Heliobacteriaceae bacterium]
MVLSTQTVVALRCPVCGRMDFHALSLFAFAGEDIHKIHCACGAALASVGSKDRKQFWLQVHCVMCETQHLFWYKRRELWSDQLLEICCEETMVEIGFVGPLKKVKAAVLRQNKSLQELADDLGYVDHFENPEIMCGVLEKMHNLAETGYLSCACGSSQINVEIFSDRVELRCEACDNVAVFYAESDHDLQMVKRLKEIQIQGCSPRSNGSRGTRRPRSKKSR